MRTVSAHTLQTVEISQTHKQSSHTTWKLSMMRWEESFRWRWHAPMLQKQPVRNWMPYTEAILSTCIAQCYWIHWTSLIQTAHPTLTTLPFSCTTVIYVSKLMCYINCLLAYLLTVILLYICLVAWNFSEPLHDFWRNTYLDDASQSHNLNQNQTALAWHNSVSHHNNHSAVNVLSFYKPQYKKSH